MVAARRSTPWQKMKKKAPKVPDITCPMIDDVLAKIDKWQDSGVPITKAKLKTIQRTMERIRTANELLREGGEYWYMIAKKHLSKKKIL